MHFNLLFRAFIIFLLSFSSTFSCYSKGYKITITMEGVENTDAILAHYVNKSIYPDDTVQFNAKGQGTFKGIKPLPQGMYVIYFSGKYFEFIIGEDQDFSIRTDTTNFVLNASIEGSEENDIFYGFQKYMISKREDLVKFQDIIKNSDNEKDKSKARASLKELTDERISKIENIVEDHPDYFVSTFFKATLEVKVPDPPVNEDGSIDSTWQYKYYKNHYFDNFNPHDGRLLNTPLYEDKIMNYLEKTVLQIPDTLIKEVDFLLDGALKDSALFRYLLASLFNYYGNSNIMGLDAVQVHLAEKYYLKEAWWIDDKFETELRTRIAVLKPLIINNVAPDIELLIVPGDHFIAAQNDTALKKYPHVGQLMKIHNIEAEFIVLFFWEANCSHCKKAVPKMHSIYKEKLEPLGIKVVAISTLFGEEGKAEWIDFVNKHKTYDWMNAWNPYDYQYKIQYDIRSTPQIFILDKDKKIIGKRLGPEQVFDLIQSYKKYNKISQ